METPERFDKWYVYTFIADRPVRSVKAKIRALTHKTSQWDLAYLLTRLGQIMRGWANYFKHAVAKSTFSKLDTFTWWRLVHMLRARHGWNWGLLPSPPDHSHRAVVDGRGRGRVLPDRGRNRFSLRLPRYPDPYPLATHESRLTAATVESPLPRGGHDGSASGPGNQTGGNTTLRPGPTERCPFFRQEPNC